MRWIIQIEEDVIHLGLQPRVDNIAVGRYDD